jgi:hypothetical protein
MKYYTSKLWSMINSPSQKERDEADIQWEKNNKEYSAIFETVKARFSKNFLKIYLSNNGFHDFRIKNIIVNHKEYGIKNPVSIDLYLTDDDINTFKITYKNVKKFDVNYEEDEGWTATRGFDDWGYDEFLPIDEINLSHEILFASGSTILIHFKNIMITKI